MTLCEFKLLSDAAKIELLYREGTYIGKRKLYGSFVILYQLEGFYVEIFYKKYRTAISHITCFTSASEIDPYLEQMDIYNLIKHQIK